MKRSNNNMLLLLLVVSVPLAKRQQVDILLMLTHLPHRPLHHPPPNQGEASP
eukprot:GDKH01018962.1.p3 GENE.GDKH01018962.1~~GDKH01018962.1.p3  ORF type:complete len:52 (+),score=0.76 GDKH01018962.1:240-395(+)